MNDQIWQEVDDLEKWDKDLINITTATFLQAFEFGQFHRQLGNKVWNFGVKRNGQLVSFSQVIKLETKFGSFFYIPGGPILDDWDKDLESLVAVLKTLGQSEAASFIRFDPRVLNKKQMEMFHHVGLTEASGYTQPQASLTLDLTKSVDELKTDLSDSTRYNVGWVERKGVKVKISTDVNDFSLFTSLLEQTASRHKFKLYRNKNYYKEQFLTFAQTGKAKLFLAYEPEELGQDILASAVVIAFGDTTTYLHAASSSKSPKLRAPYLMQWHIIEDAKKSGFKKYDFWGVAKDDSPTDPWAGVTEFKKGFGGEKVSYQKPFDLVINRSYYVQTFIEKARPLLKKLKLQ